jgi:membrane-associated protease RseP (regulator of RpoE activity)
MMSVALDFHSIIGAPEPAALEVFRVIPLWHGQAHYRSDANHFRDFFDPRTVVIDANVEAARIFCTVSGHSQVGEFTPSQRAIVFEPQLGDDGVPLEGAAPVRFENRLWKSDGYLNPNRPQYGTWKFSRAGWAPGAIVEPWWIELTPHLRRGATVRVRYEPRPYEFAADQRPSDEQLAQALHIVRCYLLLYRKVDSVITPPVLMVGSVQEGGAAAKAGMRAGDYLASYDRQVVTSIEDLRAAISAAVAAGRSEILVVIYRGSERLELRLPSGPLGMALRQ